MDIIKAISINIKEFKVQDQGKKRITKEREERKKESRERKLRKELKQLKEAYQVMMGVLIRLVFKL